jgi:hypothetical protein
MRPTSLILRITDVFAHVRATRLGRNPGKAPTAAERRRSSAAVEVVSEYGISPSFPPIR